MVRFPSTMCCMIICIAAASFLSGCGPMNGYVMNDSGQQYYKLGDYELARKDFHKAMMDNPLDANYAHNYATASHKLGDADSAERVYKHALNIDPSHQPSYHGLAKLLMEQKRNDEAKQLLSTWVGTQPYTPESHVELAWFERKQGNYDEAEQSLHNALKVDPKHHLAMTQLGQVYEDRGETGQAISYYQNALALNNSQPLVKKRLTSLNAKPTPMQITQRHRTYPAIRDNNLEYNDSPNRNLNTPQPLVRNAVSRQPNSNYPTLANSSVQQTGYARPRYPQQNVVTTSGSIFTGQPRPVNANLMTPSPIQNGLRPTMNPVSATIGHPSPVPAALRTNPQAAPLVANGTPVVAPF